MTDSPEDQDTLLVLSTAECMDLLRVPTVGRVAFDVSGDLMIFPVNYRVHGASIVIATTEQSEIAQLAQRNHTVAFEADYIDTTYRQGWSVLVHGAATVGSDPASYQFKTALEPWAGGDRHTMVEISTDRISGRSVRHRSS